MLIALLHLCIIDLTIGDFPLTCPSKPHWNFRAKSVCNNIDDYMCLWDVNYQKFIEQCKGLDIQRTGFRKVIEGGITAGDCTTNRYQPRIWTTKGNFDCEFEKSLCNDIGQVVYDDGDGVTDRSCGCDYNAGYAFLQQPANLCYCIPSVEDCTCVKKICPEEHVVDPEYQCRSIRRWKSSFSCRETLPCGSTGQPCREDSIGSSTVSPDELTNDRTIENPLSNKFKAFIALFVVLLSFIGIVLGLLLHKDSLFTKQLVSTIVYEGETAHFACEVIDEKLEVIWSVNGETIKAGDRYEMRSNGCIRELLIYNVEKGENDMKITAMAYGQTSTATLAVKASSFSTKMSNALVQKGDTAVFSCELYHEMDTVQWFVDSKPINHSKRYTEVKDGKRRELRIDQCTLEDDKMVVSVGDRDGEKSTAQLFVVGKTYLFVLFFWINILFLSHKYKV